MAWTDDEMKGLDYPDSKNEEHSGDFEAQHKEVKLTGEDRVDGLMWHLKKHGFTFPPEIAPKGF